MSTIIGRTLNEDKGTVGGKVSRGREDRAGLSRRGFQEWTSSFHSHAAFRSRSAVSLRRLHSSTIELRLASLEFSASPDRSEIHRGRCSPRFHPSHRPFTGRTLSRYHSRVLPRVASAILQRYIAESPAARNHR